MRGRRRGGLLVELLVALPLAALLVATATALAVHAARTASDRGKRAAHRASLGAGLLALRAEVRRTAPADLLVAADSGLVLRPAIADGIVCAADAETVVLARPRSAGDHPWSSSWAAEPAAGDALVWWADDSSWLAHPAVSGGAIGVPAAPGRREAAVASVGTGRCGVGGVDGAVRLTLAVRDPYPPPPGVPLRVLRRVAWRHYRGVGGWMLGRREARAGGGWTGTQPVAGPLASAARGGLRVERQANDRLRLQLVAAGPAARTGGAPALPDTLAMTVALLGGG